MSNTNYCEIYGKFLHCMINTTDPSKCVGDDVLKNMRRYPGNDYTYYTNVNNILKSACKYEKEKEKS